MSGQRYAFLEDLDSTGGSGGNHGGSSTNHRQRVPHKRGAISVFFSGLRLKILKHISRAFFLALFVIILTFGFQAGQQSMRCHSPALDIHALTQMDYEFSFAERERGNLEAMFGFGPRSSLPKKAGLIAVAAGAKSKPRIDKLITMTGFKDFSYVLFHWDNSTWTEFPWYKNVTSVRQLGQTKYWFAKRVLTPHIVQNYDYVWIWDDDFGLGEEFDALQFVETLRRLDVHFAQPAIIGGGEHFEVTRRVEGVDGVPHVGRYVNFVEMMFPVISSAAWSTCAWRLIPYDGKAFWGVDNMWYPLCGAQGFCRMAVLDKFPVRHEDTRNLGGWTFTMTKELVHYRSLFTRKCNSLGFTATGASPAPKPVRDFCHLWMAGYSTTSIDFFQSFGDIEESDIGSRECPVDDFPDVDNRRFNEGLGR